MNDKPASPEAFRVLLTAEEAFPELERLFLTAKSSIALGFRIFDLHTDLISEPARAIGTRWFDLIVDTLQRGVSISVTLSDFDPVVVPDYHRRSWVSLRAWCAAGEVSGRPELLRARCSMHPSRAGLIPRFVLWPRTRREIYKTVDRVADHSAAEQKSHVRDMPALRRHIRISKDGIGVRRWVLPELVPVTHHQKLGVFDDETVYVGGLDLNNRRYDTLSHDREGPETWHDVQLLLSDPDLGKAARAHLDCLEAVTQGAPAPVGHPQFLRTVSRKRHRNLLSMSPKVGLTELAQAHHQDAQRSSKLIYLESQFFRDTNFARWLATLARQSKTLGLLLVLPAAPEDVAFDGSTRSDARYGEFLQAKCIDIVRQAFGQRVFVAAPAQPRSSTEHGRATLYGAPLVYLHAKVSVFDVPSAIVSSANLNGRSLKWDTEAGIRLTDPDQVKQVRTRCFTHWLGPEADPACFDDATAVDAWRDHAMRNTTWQPEDRKGFMLPYASRPARRLGRNLPGIPEEMV